MLTLSEAQSVRAGSKIYSTVQTNADGTPMRARVTSVKMWKTKPRDVVIKLKHGLFDYGKLVFVDGECEEAVNWTLFEPFAIWKIGMNKLKKK
jgi:hypothetical protein